MSKKTKNKKSKNIKKPIAASPKQTAQVEKNSFFDFPSKINLGTILGIVILYGVLLFVGIAIVFPDPNYAVTLDYPNTITSYDVNPYVFVRNAVEKTGEDGELKNSTQMFVYVQRYNNPDVKTASYSISALDNKGVMSYYLESSKAGYSLPISHNSSSNIKYSNRTKLEKLFLRVKYTVEVPPKGEGLEKTIETREIKFSENVIQFDNKAYRRGLYGNNNEIENIARVDLTMDTYDKDQYKSHIKVILTNPVGIHKVNLQSWIITDKGEIFPFVGIYNYSHKASYQSIYPTYINKYINPAWIYTTLQYRNIATNELHTLLYKVQVSELLAANE